MQSARHAVSFALALSCLAVAAARTSAAPSNDDCAAATTISAVPFSADVDTSSATTAAADPALCGGAGQGGHSVWFTFTPAQSGVMRVETFASDYDTVVGVFRGSCANPILERCNDDLAQARTSEVLFPAHAGTPLLIEVAGFVGTTRPPDNGHLHVSLDFVPDKSTAKSLTKCQQTLEKSGSTFVTKLLGFADKCVNGLLACVQAGSDPACIAKQCAKCDTALGQETTLEQKLKDALTKSCGTVSFAELMATSGIGYELVGARCAADFGTPLAAGNDLTTCLGKQHGCQAGKLFAAQEPRARELIALCPSLPQHETTDCLPDHGSGGALGDATAAKAVLKCETTVKKAAAKFVAAKLKSLEKCVDAAFACVATKPTDDTCLTGPAGKIGGAESKCDKQFATIAAAMTKLGPAIDKKCAGIDPFSLYAGANGANVAALASECAALGVADVSTLAGYELCLFRQHECLVDDLIRFEAPLAEGMFQLVTPSPELDDAFCPSPLRTSS